LRNYSEYLGLDQNEMLTLFHSLQVQESNKPLEALLVRPKKFPRALIVVIIVAVLAAGGALAWFLMNRMPREEIVEEAAPRQNERFEWETGPLNERFYVGDVIIAGVNDQLYEMGLAAIDDSVRISTPAGDVALTLNSRGLYDLNSDGVDDVSITAAEFSPNNPEMGAQLRMEYLRPAEPAATEESEQAAAAASPEQEIRLPGSQTQNPQASICNAQNPYPFTVRITFQGYCLFRWEILREANRQGRTENYFSRDQELSIQAQNGVRLWVSNAATARLQVIGSGQTVAVSLGSPGEVVVADIQWVRDNDGRYRLVLQRLAN
jgi:cytoskeletal protein RodZ